MKISIYVFTLIALLSGSCSAVDYATKAVKPKTFAGTLEQYYPFEIELKDDITMTVNITSQFPNGENKIDKLELDPSDSVGRLDYNEIDINNSITIELNGKSSKKNYRVRYILDPNVKSTPRTVYLKIENGKLLPRVGSAFGSKTPSGLSVKNNITAKQIHLRK